MENQSTSYAGPVLIIIAALLWAFDGLIRQHLYVLPPITIIFFEHLIGFIILLPFAWHEVKKIKLSGKVWWLLAVIATLSGLLGTLWFTSALGQVHYISLSVVFLLQKLQPIFAIAAAYIFLQEKLTKKYIIWAVLAIVSAFFVTFNNGIVNFATGSGTAIAALYALGAAFAWGSATAFSKMLLDKMSARASTFYRFLFTLVIALPFVYLYGRQNGSFAIPTLPQFALLALIAISTGMVALLIYYKGLSKVSVHVSTILELTFPFVAILIDMVVNKNFLSVSQWLAAIVLVFSIYKIALLRQDFAG